MNKLTLLLVSCLLSACSTMSPKECQNANWRNIGYSDAMQGRHMWLQSRTEACAKVNIKLDRKAYIAGHKAGSNKFCTYENGVAFGRSGDEPRDICTTPEQSKRFYRGYEVGREIYKDLEDLREKMHEPWEWLHDIRYHRM